MRGCKKCCLPPLFPREIASRGDRCNFEQIASWLLRYVRLFEQIHVHVCNVAHYAVAVTRDGLYLMYHAFIHSLLMDGGGVEGAGGETRGLTRYGVQIGKRVHVSRWKLDTNEQSSFCSAFSTKLARNAPNAERHSVVVVTVGAPSSLRRHFCPRRHTPAQHARIRRQDRSRYAWPATASSLPIPLGDG